MALHDWTRVTAGTYHDFHNAWITHLKEALNEGLLPPPYYALGEQRSGGVGPDYLALRDGAEPIASTSEAEPFVERRTLVIRHASGDRIVALVEIMSPANKHSRATLYDFVEKVLAALRDGTHVLVIDPLPPTRNDPQGIHGVIWEELLEPNYLAPADRPRTLVSYRAGTRITAYVEPTAVGAKLTEMPLFLTKDHYIRTPLDATYMQAYAGVPQRWRRVIEEESTGVSAN